MMGRANTWMADFWKVLAVIAFLSVSVFFATALDREPALLILPADEPIELKAGTLATVRVRVVRDLSRQCSVEYDRYLIDSAGVKHDVGRGKMSPDMIRELESNHPGWIVVRFAIPPVGEAEAGGVAQNGGRLIWDLRHECTRGHVFFPIRSTQSVPIVIVP